MVKLLDEVRAESGVTAKAHVSSVNHFPTAAGLASSASGFAALAGAASAAAGLDSSAAELSARARHASASAARSIFGGFVELAAGEPGDDALSARRLAGPEHWDLRVVVAVTAEGRKAIGSRSAMGESRRTSRLLDAWVETSRGLTRGHLRRPRTRDMERLVPLVEQSFFAMHAVAMTASPIDTAIGNRPAWPRWPPCGGCGRRACWSVRPWTPGPHVKAVCREADVERVQAALASTEGVLRTLVARPGPGLEVEAL